MPADLCNFHHGVSGLRHLSTTAEGYQRCGRIEVIIVTVLTQIGQISINVASKMNCEPFGKGGNFIVLLGKLNSE